MLCFGNTKTAHFGPKSRYSEIRFSQNPLFAPSLKVSSAEISILDGLLKDRTAILHLNNLTVWGHKATKADLSHVLKKFDPMSVEVR